MGSSSKTPDFGQVAVSQGDENRRVVTDQLYANRPSQISPWGYTSWGTEQVIDPATGEPTTQWTQTTGLTPELQEIFNKQTAIQGGRTDLAGQVTGRMMDEYGRPIDYSGLTPWADAPQMQQTLGEGPLRDPYETRQAAEDAVYNQAMSRITPQFDSQRQSLEIKLRNQGLSPGDAAYDSQMQSLGQQQNDATNQALWSANQAGRAESGQMFNMDLQGNQNAFNQALQANNQNYNQTLSSAQIQNQLRQAQGQEIQQQRGYGLNELNALLNGQQVGMPSMPNFQVAQAAAPAPIYNSAVDSASAANAADPFGAVLDAGSAVVGAYLGRPQAAAGGT